MFAEIPRFRAELCGGPLTTVLWKEGFACCLNQDFQDEWIYRIYGLFAEIRRFRAEL